MEIESFSFLIHLGFMVGPLMLRDCELFARVADVRKINSWAVGGGGGLRGGGINK
jgi:hypothetical protein